MERIELWKIKEKKVEVMWEMNCGINSSERQMKIEDNRINHTHCGLMITE